MSDARIDGPAGWRVAAAAMLCLVVGPSALLVGSFGTLVDPLARSFGWTRGAIGVAVSLMAATIVVVSPVQGMLIDRIGARRLVLLSIPALAGGLVALALLPASLPLFYAMWVAMPVLAIGLWPAGYLKATGSWFLRRLGLAIGVVNAGIGIGMIAMPAIVHRMMEAWGPRGGFIGMAGLVLLAWPTAFVALRERPTEVVARAARDPGELGRYRTMIRQREWRTLAVGFFLLGIAGTGLIANLVPILMSRGLPAGTAVAGMALFGVAALIGRIGTGLLLDRFHAVPVANVFAGVAGVAMLVLAGSPSTAFALGAAAALGFISGAEFDVLAYTLRRYFGLAAFGRMYGAIFSVFQLGAGLGAALLAASVGYTDDYAPALVALAASSGVFMLVMARLPAYPVLSSQP